MALRQMVQQLREDFALLERASPASYAADLSKVYQQANKTAQELSKLAGNPDDLDADQRRQLAALFKSLRDQEEKARAALARIGVVLVAKDMVSMPTGSTGYS